MTDASAQVLWWRDQTPFGQTVAEGGFSQNPLRFPGQIADAESGLAYNYFRDYDPALGRYIQSDPIGLGDGPNTYAYVGGNPLSYIDPSGEGKLKFFIWLGRNCWKQVSEKQARKALANDKWVGVAGPRSTKKARQMMREQSGKKTVRHDGHDLGGGKTGRPHYQHKNGGGGKVYYTLKNFTFVGAFGSYWYTEVPDFFNPVSDAVEIIELANPEECSGCSVQSSW